MSDIPVTMKKTGGCMSLIETEENTLSGTDGAHIEDENPKLVPVAESIRYRKRAQSAEKKAEALSQQLAEAEARASEMAEQLNSIQTEQELTRKLAAAGAADLETAVLIAKARVEGQAETDIGGVIEHLRKEKQYLFGGQQSTTATTRKTAGAKDRITTNQAILERAAKKAATTGNRADLQEYLKLRRSFV
jgi:hypothetical protein